MLLSTTPRRTQGLMTVPTVRCPSTWSVPSCESSSVTKIAELAQSLLCEMASTTLPTARSLSAFIARGVG